MPLKTLKRWFYWWAFLYYCNCFAAGYNLGTAATSRNPGYLLVTIVCIYSAYTAYKYQKEARFALKVAEYAKFYKIRISV